MTMEIVKHGEEEEYSIKPQAATPQLDTSSWPLLLKNYDKRKFSPSRDTIELHRLLTSSLQSSFAPVTSRPSPPDAAR